MKADSFSDAEKKIERNLDRNPDGKYEIWIKDKEAGQYKLAYRVSNVAQKKPMSM